MKQVRLEISPPFDGIFTQCQKLLESDFLLLTNRTDAVKIIVEGWVVYFFATPYPCRICTMHFFS